MPTYESTCPECGKYHTYYASVTARYNTPECCGVKTLKTILTPAMGYVENIAYTSPIDGRPITTKQQREEDLKRSGSRPWEGLAEEQKEADRRKAYEEAAQDKKLEATIERTIKELPDAKKKELAIT